MKQDGFPAQVVNFADARFSDASTGTRSSLRSLRRSHVFRRQDCDFPILIATNISTFSRLSSESLAGSPAGWIMFGFAILMGPGENRRVSERDDGYSSLV